MIIGHVRGQELKLDRTTIAADSIKYLEAEFHFAGRDWDGYVKTAYFINGASKFALVLADDRITADMGLNLTAGEWEVKLSGVKGDSRITTTTERIYVREFGSTDGTLPDVTATQAEQILAKIGDLSDLTTEDKTNLVAAINEAAKSGGGSGGETPSTYTVTQTLGNVSSSNGGTSVQAGAAYTTTLTANDGYTIGTVTVTMGGTDITATAWDASTGTITIAQVTGDVRITATASAATLDTSPAIAKTGYSLNSNGEEYEYATDGACYTEFYTLKTGAKTLTLYIADSVDVAFSTGGKMQFWDAAQQVEYWSPMGYRNMEHAFAIANGATRFRTSLALADVESSYAYDDTGHVYFAGKNTQYYGKENIYGTASNSATKSESVDNAYMALSMSTGVTANTTAYTGLTSDYVSMVQANYDAFIADVMGDYNRIPFIVHTDQHGRIGAKNPVLKLIGDITNWYEISRCINLGDTVADRFSATTLQAYLDAAKDCIPLSRRLDVYGNHDIWDADEDQKYTVDQKRLSPYFKNIYARRHGNNGYFTVADDYYNVKYLVINNMEYPATNYSTRRITTAQANFIVEELSKKDGYDIILLSHVPLVTDDTMTSRDSSYQAYTETFLSDATVNTSFLAMIAARKAKTSGAFTDSEGIEHAYDFSECDSELLMSLHGHTHFEAYKALPGSITEFAFDWFDGNTFYFAYIDRRAKKFKCWKNEIDVATLEIDI